MQPKLLVLLAHPDDEAFGIAGTIAQLADRRGYSTLVCATRGEVGEIAHPALATPANLGQVRERELRAAAQAMRLDQLIFLDHRDSGMAGTAANADPRAFANQPAEAVVPRLVGLMRRLQPQVVVTFDPTGGYGHPDHLAIHQHTVAAFHAAGDPARYPDQGAPWQPQRLFYMAIPRSFFAILRNQLVALGEDPSDFDRFAENATPDDQIHATVEVTDKFAAKWAAFAAHRTQFGENDLFRRMAPDDLRQITGYEHFVLAWPPPEPGLRLDNLFAGL
jgi:LmbE family N-acetylglucosaminyl deacetylase